MRALALDYRSTPRLPKIGLAILIVAVAAAIHGGIHYREVETDIVKWEEKKAEAERLSRHKPAKARQAGAAELGAEIKQAKAVLLQLALPWNELFNAMEVSDYEQVALLAIEPDPQKNLVRISGEARTLTCVLNYVKVLQAAGSLDKVFLQSHQIQNQDADKPVRFTIVAAWVTS
jgi:Tfp pilus assembly protein PilN